MICKTCGAYIEDDCAFCTECGTVIPNNEVQSFEPYSEQYGEQYGEGYEVTTETQKSVTKKLALITGLTVLLVAILGIILYFCSDLHHYRKNYKTGNENFAENKYEEALKCHKEAIKYKETDEVRNAICQDYIKIAEGHLKKENYEKAIKAHQELRKYGKSTKEINSLILTDYEKWADNCLDEEDFEEAMELHREMTDYGESKNDVDERIAEDYEKWADSYLEEDKPMDALLTVHQGIDATSHESLWEKAQEIKDRTVIAEKKRNDLGGFLLDRNIFVYDEKGNLLVQEGYNAEENLIYKSDSTYDEKGNVLTTKLHDKSDSPAIEDVSTYTYDEKGNLITEEHYRNNIIYTKVDRIYDEKGNLFTKTEINYTTDNRVKEIYQYDEKNNLIEKDTMYLRERDYEFPLEYYDSDLGRTLSVECRYIYTYDEQGNILTFDAYDKYGFTSDWKSYKYVYDEQGNILVEEIYGKYDELITKMVCSYDERGNLLVKETYDDDGNLYRKQKNIYDSYGNKVEEQQGIEEPWSSTFDVFGNPIASDSSSYTYTYTYHYIENKGGI